MRKKFESHENTIKEQMRDTALKAAKDFLDLMLPDEALQKRFKRVAITKRLDLYNEVMQMKNDLTYVERHDIPDYTMLTNRYVNKSKELIRRVSFDILRGYGRE